MKHRRSDLSPFRLFSSVCLLAATLVGRAALAGDSFTQTVVLSPAPPVPGLITVAPQDGGDTQSVRMLFVSDGELLSIPLSSDTATGTFRGLFPTPVGIGSYQLQLVRRSGGMNLSKRYLLPPICQEQRGDLPPSAERIWELEQEIVRARFLISALKRLEEK